MKIPTSTECGGLNVPIGGIGKWVPAKCRGCGVVTGESKVYDGREFVATTCRNCMAKDFTGDLLKNWGKKP